MPVSRLIKLPINWVRGDDDRLRTIFNSLEAGSEIHTPIRLINCGCGKTYILEDGGHRISAAYQHYKRTGTDVLLPVETLVADFA